MPNPSQAGNSDCHSAAVRGVPSETDFLHLTAGKGTSRTTGKERELHSQSEDPAVTPLMVTDYPNRRASSISLSQFSLAAE